MVKISLALIAVLVLTPIYDFDLTQAVRRSGSGRRAHRSFLIENVKQCNKHLLGVDIVS